MIPFTWNRNGIGAGLVRVRDNVNIMKMELRVLTIKTIIQTHMRTSESVVRGADAAEMERTCVSSEAKTGTANASCTPAPNMRISTRTTFSASTRLVLFGTEL